MTLKQVFIVNSELDMGKGKVAVQVAHGEVFYLENVFTNENSNLEKYTKWRHDNDNLMKKIVLKASWYDIQQFANKLKINGIWHAEVHDKGLTQIPENSLTCLVVEPLEEDVCKELFGHLKLL